MHQHLIFAVNDDDTPEVLRAAQRRVAFWSVMVINPASSIRDRFISRNINLSRITVASRARELVMKKNTWVQ